MEIRDVVDSDWAAVWGFLQQIVAAGDTYCWPPDTSEDAARMWWMGKPGGRVLVAVDDGAVVGTAELHPNQPAAGSHVANAGFMVSPTVAGRGVGRARAPRGLVVGGAGGDAGAQSGCGSRSASRFSPPSRKLSDIQSVDLSGCTSCTGSCDSPPLSSGGEQLQLQQMFGVGQIQRSQSCRG